MRPAANESPQPYVSTTGPGTGAAAKELLVEGGRVVGVRTDSTELGAAKGVILTTGDYLLRLADIAR